MKMMMAGLTVVGLMVAVSSPGTSQDRYVLEGNPAVWTLAGEVEVVRGSGSDVVVDVSFRGPDADRLSVAVDDLRGRASLRVLFDGEDVVWNRGNGSRYSTNLRVRDDGTWGGGMQLRGGRRVSVASGGGGIEAHAVLRVEVPAGRDVDIFVGVGDIVARDLAADLSLDVASGRIVAEGIEGWVNADTGSGDIELRDIAGSVTADTGSGDVLLEGVRGDEVTGDTGSGDITARGLSAASIEFDTGSGDIEAYEVEGSDVSADTGSGRVDLGLLSSVRRLMVDTGSGDVTVRFAAGADARIEADSGSGRVEVELPGATAERSGRTHYTGRVGTGSGSITIDTGSGSIRLLSAR